MSADREWPPDGESEGEEVEGSAYEDDEPYPVDDSGERIPHRSGERGEKTRRASRTDGGASVGSR